MKKKQDGIVIAVDFDGTCVTHEFPAIGKDIGATPVLKAIIKAGHDIVLNTMRSGVHLAEAVVWFEQNKIPLYGINKNPTQSQWTTSPKVYAQLYIDDAALGAPLNKTKLSDRPYIFWPEVAYSLIQLGHLSSRHFRNMKLDNELKEMVQMGKIFLENKK